MYLELTPAARNASGKFAKSLLIQGGKLVAINRCHAMYASSEACSIFASGRAYTKTSRGEFVRLWLNSSFELSNIDPSSIPLALAPFAQAVRVELSNLRNRVASLERPSVTGKRRRAESPIKSNELENEDAGELSSRVS